MIMSDNTYLHDHNKIGDFGAVVGGVVAVQPVVSRVERRYPEECTLLIHAVLVCVLLLLLGRQP